MYGFIGNVINLVNVQQQALITRNITGVYPLSLASFVFKSLSNFREVYAHFKSLCWIFDSSVFLQNLQRQKKYLNMILIRYLNNTILKFWSKLVRNVRYFDFQIFLIQIFLIFRYLNKFNFCTQDSHNITFFLFDRLFIINSPWEL